MPFLSGFTQSASTKETHARSDLVQERGPAQAAGRTISSFNVRTGCGSSINVGMVIVFRQYPPGRLESAHEEEQTPGEVARLLSKPVYAPIGSCAHQL